MQVLNYKANHCPPNILLSLVDTETNLLTYCNGFRAPEMIEKESSFLLCFDSSIEAVQFRLLISTIAVSVIITMSLKKGIEDASVQAESVIVKIPDSSGFMSPTQVVYLVLA